MDINNIGIAVVIHNPVTKKILLIEEPSTNLHSNKSKGDLSLVVGHVKSGESPIEAATREIAEETGLTNVVPDRLVKIFYFKKGHIVFLFSCENDTGSNSIGNWYDLDSVKKLHNLRPQVGDAILQFESGEYVDPKLIFTS
ncbi:NUDIX hydrolase [Patescibacteria group bacterium]|nr:NUDIX hydrolase [Patescibacteria group bacterium]